MVFAFFPSDAPWRELDLLATRAGVSVEYLCSTVEAARKCAGASINAPKGATGLPNSLYNDALEQMARALSDDDFELAIKEVAWDENQHPRDRDGRFSSGSFPSGVQAHAAIPYGAVVQPTPYVLPTRQLSASQARDELIHQGRRLAQGRKPLESKLKRARNLLEHLQAQQPSNDTQRASLNNQLKEVAKQVKAHQSALDAAESKHAAQLRQLLYVVDPTPVNVRFDIRPGYENIVIPLTSQHQKEAALTGAEEMCRLVSAKIVVGDMFFEHEQDRKKRSRYWGNQRVKLTKEAGTRVVVHEFGHGIERLNPHIKQYAIAFRNHRTQGEPIIPLSQFSPEYAPGERTRKDQFIDPYMGKIYPKDSDTEIITMGIEYFYSDPVKLATDDPEYFEFIYNTLRGH